MRYRNGYTPEGYAPDLVTSIDADNNINPDLSTGPVLSNIINVVSHASNRLIVGKVKTAGGAINDQAIYNISISAPGAGNGALFLFNPVVVDTLPLGMDFIEATEFSGSNPPVYNPLDRTVTWTWPTSPLNFNYSSNAYLIVEINDPPFNLGATVTNTTYLFGEVPSLPLFGLTPSTKSGSVSFLVASPTPGAACNGGNITAATANWMSKHILSGTSCNTFSNGWY
ncbi:hypothetical protein, partial [Umezakia ovalisporum]|uniref:hypothetical protein n=1 Tax=Umezakia ovalisporum TaxID=75695 RepID=UPI0039C6D4EF